MSLPKFNPLSTGKFSHLEECSIAHHPQHYGVNCPIPGNTWLNVLHVGGVAVVSKLGPSAKCVLVIDDEEDIREVVQASLEILANLHVVTASSSQEGVQKAQTERPDVILLDVMLPDLDGVDVFRLLQSNPSTQHIPVILLTAKAQPADRRRFEQIGITTMIAKPFKPENLVQCVLRVLTA